KSRRAHAPLVPLGQVLSWISSPHSGKHSISITSRDSTHKSPRAASSRYPKPSCSAWFQAASRNQLQIAWPVARFRKSTSYEWARRVSRQIPSSGLETPMADAPLPAKAKVQSPATQRRRKRPVERYRHRRECQPCVRPSPCPGEANGRYIAALEDVQPRWS